MRVCVCARARVWGRGLPSSCQIDRVRRGSVRPEGFLPDSGEWRPCPPSLPPSLPLLFLSSLSLVLSFIQHSGSGRPCRMGPADLCPALDGVDHGSPRCLLPDRPTQRAPLPPSHPGEPVSGKGRATCSGAQSRPAGPGPALARVHHRLPPVASARPSILLGFRPLCQGWQLSKGRTCD